MPIPDSFILLSTIVVVVLLAYLFRRNKKQITVNEDALEEMPPAPTSYNEIAQTENETQASAVIIDDVLLPESDEIPLTLDRPAPAILDLDQSSPDNLKQLFEEFGQYDPYLDLSNYVYPTLDLLDQFPPNDAAVTADLLEQQKYQILLTLNTHNIEIDKIRATIGPISTLFEIVPSPGIRIAQIKKLERNLAISLAAPGTKVIGHIPGTGFIGIEMPHLHPEMVTMRCTLATENFASSDMMLPLALGKTSDNNVFLVDLAKLPHLLIAGATGQGKSVAIRSMIASLLYKKHPSELKFILIDLNGIELTAYRGIERHFLATLPSATDSIITRIENVVPTLEGLYRELEERFNLFDVAGTRNIQEYNDRFINRKIMGLNHRFLPYFVIVVDEFANLLSDPLIEPLISKLAQRGRPAGIHLIISTQRPTSKIITGSVKANFSARLSFKVSSSLDSTAILESGGAESLRGNGNSIFSDGVIFTKLQGANISSDEVERITDFISKQRGYPSALLLPEDETLKIPDFNLNDLDPLFEEAARLVVMHQQGSTSLIQRKLKLGYNRTGRIIDQLEAAGIVGPFEGSKAREVLYPDEYSLMVYLENLNR